MTEKIEYEEVTAKFKSKQETAARTVFIFEDPKNPEREMKISAFEPNLPKPEFGKWYAFRVQHKPTDKGDGSRYHNLCRKVDDRKSEYIFIEASPAIPAHLPPKGYVPADELLPLNPQQGQIPMSKDDYWRHKEQREITREPVMDEIYENRYKEERFGRCIMYALEVQKRWTTIPSEADIIKSAEKFEARLIKASSKDQGIDPAKLTPNEIEEAREATRDK